MKASALFLVTSVMLASAICIRAQLTIPLPPPPNADQPPVINRDAPLASLDAQLGSAVFDQRGAFASAYDEANTLVDAQVARLRARGLVFAEEASTHLAAAREDARQVFRDLSLTTEETWPTARHHAVGALRRIHDALADLEKTATGPRG